jgi:hypothetical protein
MQVTYLNLIEHLFIGLKWTIIFGSFFGFAAWFVHYLIEDETKEKIAKRVKK